MTKIWQKLNGILVKSLWLKLNTLTENSVKINTGNDTEL